MDRSEVLIPVVVESVRVHVLSGQHVVLLQERDSARLLPIWIGPGEAHSIATRLAGIPTERPLAHDLMTSVFERLGAQVTRVVVKELVSDENGGGIFHGSVYLQVGADELEFDSRPSDAIALAVRTNARILVSETVLDRSAIVPETDDDEKLSVFKEFINSLDPGAPGSPQQQS